MMNSPKTYLPLDQETRAGVPTDVAAWHLNRRPQTLRVWACHENGPIRPRRVNGVLTWPVAELRKLCETTQTTAAKAAVGTYRSAGSTLPELPNAPLVSPRPEATLRTASTADLDRIRALAALFDCLLDDDVALLFGVTLGTLEAWRKRGKRPDYAQAGNRVLYTRTAVDAFIADRIRERPPLKDRL